MQSAAATSIDTTSWWTLSKRVLLSPVSFFAQWPGNVSFKTSSLYLVKTALITALLHALVWAVIFYVIAACFLSVMSAFVAIFGVLLTPVIAVAANIPPDKVVDHVSQFAKGYPRCRLRTWSQGQRPRPREPTAKRRAKGLRGVRRSPVR